MDSVHLDKSDFVIIGCDDLDSESVERPHLSYWRDAFRRLRKNPVAIASLILLALILLMTLIGPLISGYSQEAVDIAGKNQRPSARHWFGTDVLGRDLFTRVCQGGRSSMVIALIGTLICTLMGCAYGAVAAFAGGIADMLMMRLVEIISSVPYLMVVILLSTIFDTKGLSMIILALVVTGWCGLARLIRGQMLAIKSHEYVLAARALGVSPGKIIWRHFLPNTIGVIVVSVSFSIPQFIFAESFISYLGLGIQAPATSWGTLASAAQSSLMFYPYQIIFPSLMIALTMFSFTMLGDGLRDALDPKLRR